MILDVVGFGTKTYGSSMPKFYGTIQKPILLKIVPKTTIWQPWFQKSAEKSLDSDSVP